MVPAGVAAQVGAYAQVQVLSRDVFEAAVDDPQSVVAVRPGKTMMMISAGAGMLASGARLLSHRSTSARAFVEDAPAADWWRRSANPAASDRQAVTVGT